jgi:hypothetical protein
MGHQDGRVEEQGDGSVGMSSGELERGDSAGGNTEDGRPFDVEHVESGSTEVSLVFGAGTRSQRGPQVAGA